MINHKHKIIFIHIPKCAGSSVEYFFEAKPFDWKEPNYEFLTGWCPKRKIHMHHATPRQLLETELIDQDTWDSYYKFAIVRNPWARAVSDYFWLNRFNYLNTTFEDFLNKRGNLKKILTDNTKKEYRGDHLYPQSDFLKIGEKEVLDKILYFENIKEEFAALMNELGIPYQQLPHDKKSKKFISHYSHFFKEGEEHLVDEFYSQDISLLNYSFEDKRDELSGLRKFYIQAARRLK